MVFVDENFVLEILLFEEETKLVLVELEGCLLFIWSIFKFLLFELNFLFEVIFRLC